MTVENPTCFGFNPRQITRLTPEIYYDSFHRKVFNSKRDIRLPLSLAIAFETRIAKSEALGLKAYPSPKWQFERLEKTLTPIFNGPIPFKQMRVFVYPSPKLILPDWKYDYLYRGIIDGAGKISSIGGALNIELFETLIACPEMVIPEADISRMLGLVGINISSTISNLRKTLNKIDPLLGKHVQAVKRMGYKWY